MRLFSIKDKLFKFQYTRVILILIFLLQIIGCSKPNIREFKQMPVPEDAHVISQTPGQTGGIFIQSEAGELATLNPLVASDASSGAAIGLLLGALTSYDWVKGEVIPGLAKSWDIGKDQKTFTFHLRKGVFWSDGAPFSADDIIFSYECYYDDRFPNRTKFFLTIEGEPCKIEKLDDYTVRITSPEVYAPFLSFVAGVSILPKHKLQNAFDEGTLLKEWSISTAKNNPEDIISLGPCVLRSYRPGERIVYARNPNYYAIDKNTTRLPYIDYIIAKMVSDTNAMTVVFAQGQTDSETIRPGDVAWVKRSSKTHDFRIIDRGPSSSRTFIWFNLNPGKNADGKPYVDPNKSKWFNNLIFRQAVSYGIDRDGIVEGVLFGRGAPQHSSVSIANKKWHNPNIKKYPYNPEYARELLISEGYFYNDENELFDADGNRISFKLQTNKENDIRTEMATVFKENMYALGIEVILQFVDFNTLVMKISDSFEYDASLLGLTSGSGEPASGMDVYSSGGRMHMWHPQQKEPATKWEARIDELMKSQLTTLNVDDRKKYYFEVQEIMAEQQPFIHLVTPNLYSGIKNKWQNVNVPTLGGLLWNIDEIWSIEK